jgi:hypothetical protein
VYLVCLHSVQLLVWRNVHTVTYRTNREHVFKGTISEDLQTCLLGLDCCLVTADTAAAILDEVRRVS